MKSLKQRILAHIKADGPISIGAYMAWALLDPKQGYYPTRDPLGIDGDFITAPEISQMFGEVLGLWLIDRWRALGRPDNIALVEYGPGRGVMMSDMLRTARLDKDFFKSLSVYLIETSAALESKQAETLADCGVPVRWIENLETIEPGPTLMIGNEYLDCLPIRQFVMTDRFAGHDGWRERLVGLHPDKPDELAYVISPTALLAPDRGLLPPDLPELKDGDLLEVSPGVLQMVESLQTRFSQHKGAALFIDYGPESTEYGDSFQALKKHEKVYPLDQPGQADLTARVDFSQIVHWAKQAGLDVLGPVTQASLLSKLGIEVRAVALARSAPTAKPKIARQLRRLTHEDEMGGLFKAICLQAEGLTKAIGF